MYQDNKLFLFILISLLIITVTNSGYIPLQSHTINYGDSICQVSECAKTFFCSNFSSCNISEKTCDCDLGYTSKKEDGIVKCCYQQKRRLRAFLLETFITFGAGHYYVGKFKLFIIKLVIYILLILTNVIIVLMGWFKKDKFNFNLNFIRSACLLLCGCTFIGWQIIDAVLFMLGGYNDVNGVELY